MKTLMGIIVVLALSFATSDTADAGVFNRRMRPQRLWSPGIIVHMTHEWYMMNHSGPRMVWRGDWVSVTELRR